MKFSTRTRSRAALASLALVGSIAAVGCVPEAPGPVDPTTPTTVAPTTTVPQSALTTCQGGATVSIQAAPAAVGGTVRLVGTNWAHPTNGGSTIAIKINEGAFSRLAGEGVHANLTIWQIIEVGPSGSFDVNVQLPTAANSTPAFSSGNYSLRLLTGSLKSGDTIRTCGGTDSTLNFTVS